ncbi:MAG: hypothetical protein OEV68_07880, partial [candidate division Zixibacteria bacterium]|nr:hypothetical protein [candidate division Zixibacteria bacterium]
MKLSHTVLASLLIIVTQMVGTAAATEPGTPVIDRSRASIELPVSTPLDHQNRAINPKEAPDRLASAVDTCLDLSYAGSPAFVWPLPSNSGIVEYAMRFDGDGAQVLTSVEIPIYNNGDGEFGDNNLHLAIYEDDGDGLPGTLIAADTILAGTYSSYPASTLFDLESLNLVVNDTFHVGIATDAAPGMGENELIISDDGSGGLGRSSLYAFGAWMTLPDAFGTDESFLMNVVLCPIVDMSDTAGMGITISGPGAGPGNTILCGQTIDFNIHLRNNTGNDLLHLANGFHLYSLNAISWATPTFSVDPAMSTVFPQTNTFTYSLDGAGADSVSLDYLTVVGGLPPDWEGTVATLATTFSCADTGMVACIDSCWTPGSGPWTWWPNGGSPMPPSWTGPHCFMVAPDSLFGIEIVFEHDVQASETIHFANNIPPNNPVHIQFKPWVHFLPESVPIKVLHDGDSSEYTFHVSDISGNWMMPLDTHEIVFNDTVMWQLDEGTHEYRVDLGVDSTTITRLREYITQDKPFADGGCWAVPQLSLFDPSLELYRIDTHFPPYDPIFRVYYTDARFFRPNVTYEYDFSVSADISQEFNLNGTMDIDVTSLYCMKLHGRSILCGDINLSARELGPDLGQIPRMATLDFPSLFEIDPIRLYKGYMVKIKAGKLLNIEAGGSIKLRDASLEHDTYLRLPCDPYVFGVAITPHLDVGVKAYGKLELLGGAASAKARIWAETEFSIPCSLKVAPDFSFDISADPCFFLDLKYRATVKAWKLSYTYQGSYTLIDTCLSVHLPSGETRDQGRIPMTTSVADSRYYGPPALASHGSASMSVFVNSQSPGDEQIYYSKLDTTSGWAWTAPAKMTTSNDAKFHPDITNLGDT